MLLRKSIDWNIWFFFIQIRAEILRIWNQVDSNQIYKESLKKSVVSVFYISIDDTKFDANRYQVYKVRCHQHKMLLDQYDRQKRAYDKLNDFILNTLSIEYATYISDMNKSNAHS